MQQQIDRWLVALRAAGLELRRIGGQPVERADEVRAFGVSVGVLSGRAEPRDESAQRDGVR